jgi:chromate transporter
LWFALHVWFSEIAEIHLGPLRLLTPAIATINWAAIALTAVAMLATFRFHLGIPKTLAACAVLGLVVRALT